MFYFDEINGKKIIKSDFLKGVPHFFTTRETIIKSKDKKYEKLISENKADICRYLKILPENFIKPSQTHSTNISVVKIGQNEYPETDGLILANQTQAIYLNFADCTPVILYDKKQNIGAISHAGWRGTAQKIAPLTVQKMMSEFNSKSQDIVALIGPAISMCCYNVGSEVFEKLRSTVECFDGLYEIRRGDVFVDLKAINKTQLMEIGVKQIDVAPYCTVCNNDLFFSYRKENATTCRHSAVLMLGGSVDC